jgi:predicted NBD/HSP70 family sugar kinase
MTTGRAPARPAGVRSHNLALLLWSVAQEPSSRADLASRTGLTKAAVSSMVDDLVERQLLTEDLPAITGRGRPSKLLRLHPSAPTAVGLELNVDYVGAVRTTLDGHELAAHRAEIDSRALPLRDLVLHLVAAWRSVVRPIGAPVLGTGVAVPGVVDHAGIVLRATNVPALTGANVAAAVAGGLRVSRRSLMVDNEANLAALAERHTTAAERDFVYVSGEVGVGAGIVIGGELFRGSSGMAGELGHVCIETKGRPCGCGGRGCVEQYAGQDALLRAAGVTTVDALTAGLLGQRRKCVLAVANAGSALGVGLADLLNVIDVPTVVLGGLYAQVFDHLAPSVRDELDRRVLAADVRRPTVRAAHTGPEAAVRGAAAAVVQRALADGTTLFS